MKTLNVQFHPGNNCIFCVEILDILLMSIDQMQWGCTHKWDQDSPTPTN